MKFNHVKNLFILSALIAFTACVDSRPVRNGLRDEAVYLDKATLLEQDTAHEDYWLMKSTVIGASSPNIVGDYAFPGFESELKMVRFRFTENNLQVLDGMQYQADDLDNPNDDTPTRLDRMIMEFNGDHVDVKLRESLDGERTNFLEENYEEPWKRRQKFKVDFETSSMDPVAAISWFYGEWTHECGRPISTQLVPDSYEFDEEGRHISWVLEVNYMLTIGGYCWADQATWVTGTETATVRYRLSFYQPERVEDDSPEKYEPQVIDEKDPVNKKYGAFQHLNVFKDGETGLLDAHSLTNRFNPKRTEPLVFYFHEGFPPRFKPMFEEIKAETNAIMEEAGANLRVDFQEWNEGGIERNFGDIRYSFVVWHQDIGTTRGLLGYGPSSVNPTTGEKISANLHLYNIGMDYYRFMIQDYLETNGAPAEGDTPWEEIDCEEGETVVPADNSKRLRAGLFKEMRRTLEIDEPSEDEDPTRQFIPTPKQSEESFISNYMRLLPEYRYVRPEWNEYMWQTTGRNIFARYADRLATEVEYNNTMHDILHGHNPFGHAQLHTRAGIEAQNEFAAKMRGWRRNSAELHADESYLLGRQNVMVFNAYDALNAAKSGARKCVDGKWESNEAFKERIIEEVVFHVAIHELGHNLSLRHNFYGSVDAAHMDENELTSSVMDYVWSAYEAGTKRSWGAYDVAALKWIYGTEDVRDEMMAEDFLYCTDEHRFRSPLCRAHDVGITPSQIVLNAIERYDWLYNFRNRRAYRKFWDTAWYNSQVAGAIYPLLRMWYLAIFDWGGGGVQEVLKRQDQVDENRTVLTDQEYDEISIDFYNDISASMDLIMAFYDAVINQPASLRNYQTEYDPYYGDVIRLGIVLDKLHAVFAFMDVQEVYDYSPNIYTYVALYDIPFGSKNAALAQRVMDNMLGSSYDTFRWFRYLGINLFAWATNGNDIGDISLKERIAIRRYETRTEFTDAFSEEALFAAQAEDNPAQLFIHEGEQWIYTFLADQGWHLVANESRSPVSYRFIKEYNESINAGAGGDQDNFGLKILLAYYEFYNVFAGF
ncbi:MAG: zinc-dependent metalloprotease [Bradymonadia bacterium]